MGELQFLEDFNVLERYDTIIEESSSDPKKYILRGVFSRVDTPNKNRRIYPRHVMEECVNGLQESIGKRGFFGELDHPASPKVSVSNISHYVTKLAIAEDGAVIGEIIPASTSKGVELKGLMRDHARIGVSTRSMGKLKPYKGPLGEGLLEVCEGLKMYAIDIVANPSAGTFPFQIVESVEDDRIILGSTVKFREVWENIFGNKYI